MDYRNNKRFHELNSILGLELVDSNVQEKSIEELFKQFYLDIMNDNYKIKYK